MAFTNRQKNGRVAMDNKPYLPVKMNKQVFLFLLEFDQGEGLEGEDRFPNPTVTGIEYTSIEMNREAIPANGSRVWTNLDAERLKRADTANYFAYVDLWLQSDQQKKVASLYPDESYQEYLDARVALLREDMKRNGERIWWGICGEQDGAAVWPRRYFRNKGEAYQYYKDCYVTNLPGRYLNTNVKMADFEMMKKRYNVDFEKDNIAMQVSKCFSTHYPYEWGARMVVMERTGTLGAAQIGISFIRGAGRQNDGYWGIDVSGWGGVVDGACSYDENGKQICGITDSLLMREIISYFYSGANITHLESTASSNWIKQGDKFKLSPYGEKVARFGKHTLIDHGDRGETHVPFAVMLEHDHGWNDRDHRIWNGCVEYGPGDHMIDDFFDFVFPVEKEQCYLVESIDDEDYTRRLEAAAKPGDHDIDWREYERGVLNASRFGDSFDVVLENCPVDKLMKYKVIVLVGAIKINETLKDKLRLYVEAGGELVVNYTQLDRLDPDFVGARDTGEIDEFPVFLTAWGNRWDEGRMTTPIVELAEGVETLVTARVGASASTPVVTKKTLGKGCVYLTTVPYMRKSLAKPMATHCQDFLREVFSKHELVRVDGPKIQYIVSKKSDGIIVTIINNSNKDWKGTIHPVNSTAKFESCHDIWNHDDLTPLVATGSLVDVECSPYDFRVLEMK